jgi:hypothetical protein
MYHRSGLLYGQSFHFYLSPNTIPNRVFGAVTAPDTESTPSFERMLRTVYDPPRGFPPILSAH